MHAPKMRPPAAFRLPAMLLPGGDASADTRAAEQAALRQPHTISLATGQPSEVVLQTDGTYGLRDACTSRTAAAAAAVTGGRASGQTEHASASAAAQAALDRACASTRAWVRDCEARLPRAVAEQARGRRLGDARDEASCDADGNVTVHDAVPPHLLREAAELAALVGVDAVAAWLAAGELDEARVRRWLAQKRRLPSIQPLVAPYACACAACASGRAMGVHARQVLPVAHVAVLGAHLSASRGARAASTE
jgi:hypothetical protein